MKKTVLFFIFVVCALALPLLSINTDKAFANSVKSTYFLNEPSEEDFIKAFPYYIVKNSQEQGMARSYVFEYNAVLMQKILSAFNARWVRSEQVDGIKVNCYLSDALCDLAPVLGSNMQVAVRGSVVTVGMPLILGSF